MMFRFPSVICTRCTGFLCLAIIKGPPNDNYFIIEGPCLDYFTEKVSQTRYLYWNSMLCERLDDRTGIFLKSNLFIGIIYIYFHTNIYYHISMKGESI